MTYEQAIGLARQNNEAGYQFLYESTYRDKYYIALKYMKNEEDALDVLQDAYMKAFDKLDTLYEAEKFPAWLAMIVANTAKNALAKKKPVLFSEMGTENEDGDVFEYQIEDQYIGNQPELSYTKEETSELVRQLVDSLSEEQRLCILMFHMEEMSIHEIAQTLDCSENTVKSRLNYGRKNLKAKAEDLERQGYKLYGVAPLPLLLYLLHTEYSLYWVGTNIAELLSFQTFMKCFNSGGHMQPLSFAGSTLEKPDILSMNNPPSGGTGATGQAANVTGKATRKAMGKGVKRAFMHTMAGKITVAAVVTVIVAAVVILPIIDKSSKDSGPEITESSEVSTQEPIEAVATETDVAETLGTETDAAATEEADKDIPMTDMDYINLTGLTKEEMIALLAYAPSEYSGGMTDESQIVFIIELVSDNSDLVDIEFAYTPSQRIYNTETINKILSVLQIPEMTEENNAYWEKRGLSVSGNTFDVGTMPNSNDFYNAEILSAVYDSERIQINYNVHITDIRYDGPAIERTDARTAIFVPNANGKYVLSQISYRDETVAEDGVWGNGNSESRAADWKSAYAAVINDTIGWLRDTQNVDAALLGELSDYKYVLFDINQDGTPELIITATLQKDTLTSWYFCTYTESEGAYMIYSGEWNIRHVLVIYNNRLAWYNYLSASPDVSIYAITMTSNEINDSDVLYRGTVDSQPEFVRLEYCPIGDTSAIENY